MGLHDGHRKRLKAQFLSHGEDFHDHQLLELLLCYAIPQGDVNELSHALLERFGSLAGVMDALPESLQQVPGVGEHTAVRAAGEFLAPYFRQGARNEMVYLVCMDAKRKVLGVHKLGEGSVNAADITSRKVVETALAQNATTAILAHNHISGLALPSQADLTTTRRLRAVLREVGVELSDHLIFADDDMVSLRDSGFYKTEEA